MVRPLAHPREVMKNQAICMLVDNGSNFCKVKLKVVFHCRFHVWTCSYIALSFIFTRFEVQFIFRTGYTCVATTDIMSEKT